MIIKHSKSMAPASALLLTLSLCGGALASDDAWYVGGGIGRSQLEPDPNGTQSVVSESGSAGFKVYVGKDIGERFGVEGYYANLGQAEISPQGEIGYQLFGVSGLYRLYDNRDEEGQGLSVFASAGPGVMKNDAKVVTYERKNDAHFHYGLGAEYGLSNGLAARAEVELYDKDASLLSLSIAKRFGAGEEEAPYPVAKPENAQRDSDNDGVPDAIDQCEGTPEGVLVDAIGCPLPPKAKVAEKPKEKPEAKSMAPVYLARVYFALDSSYLKKAARVILDKVVVILKQNPNINLSLHGHTDSIESEKYNMWLSERRAKRVYDYMVGQGVERSRLSTQWFGESRPVATNETAAGRQKNRRTEFVIVKK